MIDAADGFAKRASKLKDKLCHICNEHIAAEVAASNDGAMALRSTIATLMWLASIYNGKSRAMGINIAADDDLVKMLKDVEAKALDLGLTHIAEWEAKK